MFTRNLRGLGLVWVATLLVSLAISAFGQVGDAEVSGLVTDPSGAPVAGAKLALTNED